MFLIIKNKESLLNKQFVPSFHEYHNILTRIEEHRERLLDYGEITSDTESFIILRHDVEFSVERAYKLSLIETKRNICASYFFQVSNNTYNIFSKNNLDILRKMHKNGHFIGLHFHRNDLTNFKEIKENISLQAEVLRKITGINIDRFSFHRPTKELLKANIKVEGLINVYDKIYFTFVEEMQPDAVLDVKYISDTMHRWNYGVPDKKFFEENKKIQVLIHPYSWTEEGYDNLNNFRSLINEKMASLIQSIDSECKHFGGIKNEL